MYDKLKLIAQDNGWGFTYARRDFQNLISEIEDKDKIYLFLDPVQRSNEFDEYGEHMATAYSGNFLLLKSSDMDEGYEERYISDIKPLIESALKTITDSISCTDLTIQTWNTTEVINLFDYNLDGIVVNYTVLEV